MLDFALKIQPLLIVLLSIAGFSVSYFNYQEARIKRKNELFDRRYKFYKMVEKWWLSTGDAERPPIDFEDLVPWAIEADFIFGEDIYKHILSLENRTHSGAISFPNDDFSEPFRKYLSLR